MATSDILGLFVSPEQYQAQQLAQQQAAEQQRAFNFAQLSPRDQAVYGMFLGGQQLARGLGGLLGVQDPQLQRIRQREEIMRSINPADMASLTAGIQRASQMGDQELALSLTDFMNKQGSEIALTKQRETEKVPQDIQIAARIRKLTEDRLKLPENERGPIDAEIQRLQKALRPGAEDIYAQLQDLYVKREEAVAQFGVDSNAVKSIDRMIQSLAPLKGGAGDGEGEGDGAGKGKYKELAISKERARLNATLRSLESQNLAGSPEYLQAQDELKFLNEEAAGKATIDDVARLEGYLTELSTIKTKYSTDTKGFENDPRAKALQILIDKIRGDKAGAPIKEVVLAEEIIKLDAFIRDAKDPTAPDVVDAKTKAQLYRDAMKRERPNIDTLGLAKGGKYDGQPVFLDETSRKTFVFDTDKEGKQIEVPYTGGLKGLKGGTEVNVGGSKVVVDTSETGKAAGKELGKELITVKDKQSAIDSIQAALSILNQGIYAGSYSDIRKGLAKYVPGFDNKAKVARTEEFVAYIGDVVVQRLKDFGGNDSNEELKYLNKIIGGDLEMEPQALKRILERADAKIRRGIEQLRRQAESGEQRKSLITTLPKADAAQAPPKPTRRFNKATGKLEVVQ